MVLLRFLFRLYLTKIIPNLICIALNNYLFMWPPNTDATQFYTELMIHTVFIIQCVVRIEHFHEHVKVEWHPSIWAAVYYTGKCCYWFSHWLHWWISHVLVSNRWIKKPIKSTVHTRTQSCVMMCLYLMGLKWLALKTSLTSSTSV